MKKKKVTESNSIKVLLVCMGNICRSPMAEGVLRQRITERPLPLPVEIDSAGTHGYHEGAPPDPRAQAATLRRGIDISDLRARRVVAADFERFDLLLAMDEDNRAILIEQADEAVASRIRLLLEFADGTSGRNVPDPYYGSPLGFERVLDLVEEAMAGLLNELEQLAEQRVAEASTPDSANPVD
ncbi:MAG: low molecular weight protein-tyrosine-phosphatase [Gammaproteobacteria bacterium]